MLLLRYLTPGPTLPTAALSEEASHRATLTWGFDYKKQFRSKWGLTGWLEVGIQARYSHSFGCLGSQGAVCMPVSKFWKSGWLLAGAVSTHHLTVTLP